MADKIEIPNAPRAIRIKDFTKKYGLSKATAYNLIKAGKLQTIKLGGCRLIPVEAAEILIFGK